MIINNPGLRALATPEELAEVRVVRVPVKLKRTFNQKTYNQDLQPTGIVKYWRVMSPWHKNYQSDLSLDGLREWRII
jgi:hypothetical protein